MIWRVDTRRDFEQLRRGPRRRSGPLTVTVGPLDATKPPRVAYAIGRKVGDPPAATGSAAGCAPSWQPRPIACHPPPT